MNVIQKIFDWKTYLFTVIAVVSFSSFIAVLFGQTIPGVFLIFQSSWRICNFRHDGSICTYMVS